MSKKSGKRTRTSSYGTQGRVSHDATKFYASRLYEAIPGENSIEAGGESCPG